VAFHLPMIRHLLPLLFAATAYSQTEEPVSPPRGPAYKLVWSDEFDGDGAVDESKWRFEEGFQRNHELQWYRKENAVKKDGLLVIEARREKFPNPQFREGAPPASTIGNSAALRSAPDSLPVPACGRPSGPPVAVAGRMAGRSIYSSTMEAVFTRTSVGLERAVVMFGAPARIRWVASTTAVGRSASTCGCSNGTRKR
jgi:hypothetical protein